MTPQRAHISDVPHLARILWACGAVTPCLPRSRSRLAELWLLWRITRAGWVRLVRDSNGPVGFIARDGRRIHALYVHPRGQGLGTGRALLDEAKQAEPQLDLYVLQDNLTARRFYMSHGFAQARLCQGEGNDENLPDLQMIWQGTARPAP